MTSSSNSSTDLTMDTLSLTLTNTRVIDGLIFAANSALDSLHASPQLNMQTFLLLLSIQS